LVQNVAGEILRNLRGIDPVENVDGWCFPISVVINIKGNSEPGADALLRRRKSRVRDVGSIAEAEAIRGFGQARANLQFKRSGKAVHNRAARVIVDHKGTGLRGKVRNKNKSATRTITGSGVHRGATPSP
jgi:hypothetical protein